MQVPDGLGLPMVTHDAFYKCSSLKFMALFTIPALMNMLWRSSSFILLLLQYSESEYLCGKHQ